HEGQEPLNGANLRLRRISMPLQVRSHPENLPEIAVPDVRGFRQRMFGDLSRGSAPRWANLEDLHALSLDPEYQVHPIPDMCRRPLPVDEGTDNLLQTLHL